MLPTVNSVKLTALVARQHVSPPFATKKVFVILMLVALAGTSLWAGSPQVNSASVNSAAGSAAAVPQGTPFKCAPPPPSMVSWWPLNETSGSIVVDIIGGHHGLLSANIGSDPYSASPPKVGNALNFIQTARATVNGPQYNFGTGNFSIDAWVKGPVSNAALGIVDKLDASGAAGFAFFIKNGKLTLRMGASTFTSTPTITYNTWQHVAVTVQRTGGPPLGQFYLNGGLAGTFTPSPASVNSSWNLVLGNYHLNAGGCTSCEVQLDEIEIFSDVVSSNDIKQIFLADKSGKCTATIQGLKFEDINGNGALNSGEPHLAGWNIKATDSAANSQTTTTDASGNYSLTVAAPGTYTISELPQTGWTQTTPVGGTYNLTVSPGQLVSSRDFGNWKKQPPCDLLITKEMKPNPLVSGQTAVAYITVKNNGPVPCQAPTQVTDVPTAGLTLVSATVPGGSCVVSSGICTYPGVIPTSGIVFTYNFNLTAPPGTLLGNCAVLNNPGDTNPSNNKACFKTIVVNPPNNQPDLTISKKVDCSGTGSQQNCKVSFTVTNNGPAVFNGILTLKDVAASMTSPGFGWAGGSTFPGWTCSISAPNTINCAGTGAVSLGPTQSTSFSMSVFIPGGNYTNCANVQGYTASPYIPANLIPEANPGNNQSCVPMP